MPIILFNIPLVHWVKQTIEKMNAAGKDDFETWSKYWLQTYKDLGGKSDNSGSKECPKHSAYGLWRLGRISNSGKTFQNWTLERINKELGKNAAYAVLALDLLESRNGWSKSELWSKVQERYQQKIGEPSAVSEQGAIRISLGLFTEGQIVSKL